MGAHPTSQGWTKPMHLFFADDLILIAKASLNQVKTIQKCLVIFYGCFGQKVNLSKTKVFGSKNVAANLAKDIGKIFRFQLTENLGSYLGMHYFLVVLLEKHICILWTRFLKALVDEKASIFH